MPFSVNQDAEYHWRNRYRRQSSAKERPQMPVSPGSSLSSAFDGPASPGSSPDIPDRSSSRSAPRRLVWLAATLAVMLGAAGALVAVNDNDPASGRAANGGTAVTASVFADAGGAGQAAPADFEALLAQFQASREASLVALRGYLLTDSEGFKTEWRDAASSLQSAADAIERESTSWTDGLKLVQLAEMKRLVGKLLAEERAVAAMIGTTNRYPGLQLFNEDVRPALDEAQQICADVLDVLLSNSSPEDAHMIDPFAKLRGDLEDLRMTLVKFTTGRSEAGPPAAASRAELSAMLASLETARRGAPASVQPKIDRLAFLIQTAQENLGRVFALRAGHRWDYADYAFRTRIMPLADELKAIVASWEPAS
ncbi:MAG: hypothetical protein WD034_01750 [Parvibaculum sp.]|uniref:hypothetical protein n=1 Tax=Parvibaculum sp. TaxID=2024848 RepID=UPI0034A0A4E3